MGTETFTGFLVTNNRAFALFTITITLSLVNFITQGVITHEISKPPF